MSTSYISGIEKVDLAISKIDMESERNSSDNKAREELEFEEGQEQKGEAERDENEILKGRISSHPLYQLLVEAHLDCLKVGDISNLEREQKIEQMEAMKKQNLGTFSQSELDHFMEAYCLALGKLKETMEEPQQKSMDFINNMHSQLRELTETTMPVPDEPTATTSSNEFKLRRDPLI